MDDVLGPIQPGDLLSDRGYLVYPNLRLLQLFAPVEDLNDFGLDGLFVISDEAVSPGTQEPHCLVPAFDQATGNVTLSWEGAGRVFQVEKEINVRGPWAPLTPLLVEGPIMDYGALTNSSQAFYRVRQW